MVPSYSFTEHGPNSRFLGMRLLYLGAGLHYWNGLSRMTSASTLNFMTMDNHRQAWAQLGLSDQFARHLGVYAKGQYGMFQYTFSINDPITNALGSDDLENLSEGSITYSGKRVFGSSASTVLAGRVEVQMLDQESNKLPYRVGTYMGKKKVFNVGVGFFNHKNGTVTIENGVTGNDVNHFAVDAYYDAPLGKGGINAYAAYYNFNYGPDYALGTTYWNRYISLWAGRISFSLQFQSRKAHALCGLQHPGFLKPLIIQETCFNWEPTGSSMDIMPS